MPKKDDGKVVQFKKGVSDPALAKYLKALDLADPELKLLRTAKNEVRSCEYNAIVLMESEGKYAPLHFDDFLSRPRLGSRDWIDADSLETLCWLQGTFRIAGFTLRQVSNAALALAHK